MRPRSLLTTFLLTTTLAHAQTPTPSTYTNPTYHFSLKIPTLTATTPGPTIFRGAEENGSASSVVVLVQNQKTTLSDYFNDGIKSITADGSTINSQKKFKLVGHDAVYLDYQNSPKLKQQLRFLILALLTSDHIYLTTCTATLKNFASHETEFHNALDSFSLAAPLTLPPNAPPMITYTNPTAAYAIAAPVFTPNAEKSIPALFRMTEPDDSTTSIAVTINPPTTRKESTDIMLAILNAEKGTLRSQKEFQLGTTDAIILDWEQITSDSVHHRFLTLKVFAKTHTYSILCTTEHIEFFTKHEQEFHQCLDSFQLNPQ